MSITQEEIDHLSKLALIHTSDEQKEKLRGQVSTIVEFVSQLDEVDVEGIEPLSSPIE